jgi:c-di-GMP-related signal transduction protein
VNTPLLRLPVVDVHGTVYSYLFMAPGEPTPVTAQMLSAALRDVAVDDVVHDRSVILPGSPEVFERVDASAPEVEVAFHLPARMLAHEGVQAAVQAQRDAHRPVLATQVTSVDELDALAGVVDGVVVEVADVPAARAAELVRAAAGHGMTVLVCGVTSVAEHQSYAEAGVAGTCGSPAVISTQIRRGALRTERLAAVRLVTVLSDPEYNLTLVERLVRHEPWMTLRLLELVNSSAMGAGRHVSSVRDALVILGRRALRDWAYVAATAGEGPDDRQMSLMVVVRASFCEAMAPTYDVGRDEAYLLGLISGITDLFEVPVENLLAYLPLAPEITDALRGTPGPYASLLELARSDAFDGAPVDEEGTRALLRGYLAALRTVKRTMRRVETSTGTAPDRTGAGLLRRHLVRS